MITIYSKENCPQCQMAISLAKVKGLAHEVLKLDIDYTKDELLIKSPQARTFPQIFDQNGLIGGISEFQRYLVSV